ncbi:site-specific integrase [Bradyrhizobium rifense]|uniref:Site-specific integrase n=2 Tax=Bradyrhizobium rifense TaxID=515499 RepID=A0A5D3KDX6_9BRAD|nr:site-specific integrase [Bradyrhizobium rifense]
MMPKPRLPFLHRHVSRHGKVTYWVKLSSRQRGRGIRIHGQYRGEEFMTAYHAAVQGTVMPTLLIGKDGKGSVGWLIGLYRHSRDWGELLSAGTRKQRGPILKQIENAARDLPITAITRKKIEEGISARTSNQGRHFKNTASALFKWAVEHELYDKNPTDGIKINRGDGEGHLAWPIELIEQFEQHWPLGSKERLMFDVFLYIGLRRGDAARLGKQHIRNGVTHLMTEKSGGTMPIYVPVHPALAASINACPSSGLAIIAKDDGTHYSKEGLGNAFREAIVAAGIPVTKKGSDEKGYSAHGLRKASATIAAESGATESELNAMFGWSGYQMAQLYTKKADRKRLAARALAKWTRPSPDDAGQSELVHLRLEKERA